MLNRWKIKEFELELELTSGWSNILYYVLFVWLARFHLYFCKASSSLKGILGISMSVRIKADSSEWHTYSCFIIWYRAPVCVRACVRACVQDHVHAPVVGGCCVLHILENQWQSSTKHLEKPNGEYWFFIMTSPHGVTFYIKAILMQQHFQSDNIDLPFLTHDPSYLCYTFGLMERFNVYWSNTLL